MWTKRGKKNSTAVLYIHMSLCDFNDTPILVDLFFLLKHANINSIIKFLYHICIKTSGVVFVLFFIIQILLNALYGS